MSYIGRCQLSGYKSIKDVSCEFNKGLNVIIGNNGSGKTNLLEFIYKVLKRDYSGLDVFKGELEIQGAEPFSWQVEGKIEEPNSITTPKIKITEPDIKDLQIQFVRFSVPEKIPLIGTEYNARFIFSEKRFVFSDDLALMPFLIAVKLFSIFHSEPFLNIKNSKELTDEFVIKILNNNFNDSFWLDLKSQLINYTPIEDLRLSNSIRVTKVESSIFEFRNIVFEYKISDQWFSWDALSDGTKRMVYIICMVQNLTVRRLGPERQMELVPIVMVEEPEAGVHPHQLHLLMTFLKDRAENQQIIITTHSPQVLDVLGSDELDRIFISEIDYKNGTIIRKLTEKETEKAKLYLKDEGLLSDYWRFSDFQRSKASK